MTGRVIAAWPSFALIGSYELLMRQIRATAAALSPRRPRLQPPRTRTETSTLAAGATGKIEIFSSAIDGYGYPDCPGHPVWLEPGEWLGSVAAGRFGLQLVANQPRSRLHSQLDVGAHSQSIKIAGREPVRMNPADAVARGLRDGELVRIFNDRGACLAGLCVDDAVRPGVVQLSTGAWYDPDPADLGFCRHGNPDVLTADLPSSSLGQGCTGKLALVEAEAYRGTPPELSVNPAARDCLKPPRQAGTGRESVCAAVTRRLRAT